MNKTILCAWTLYCISWGCAPNRNIPSGLNQRLSVTKGDTVATFTVADMAVKPNPEKQYYWYQRRQINSSQGAYSGQLLDGPYQEHLHHQLIVSGQYQRGKREGQWNFYQHGKIHRMVQYREGRKDGKYLEWNTQGNLLIAEYYAKNSLHGRSYYCTDADSVYAVKYYKGIATDTLASSPQKLEKQSGASVWTRWMGWVRD